MKTRIILPKKKKTLSEALKYQFIVVVKFFFQYHRFKLPMITSKYNQFVLPFIKMEKRCYSYVSPVSTTTTTTKENLIIHF